MFAVVTLYGDILAVSSSFDQCDTVAKDYCRRNHTPADESPAVIRLQQLRKGLLTKVNTFAVENNLEYAVRFSVWLYMDVWRYRVQYVWGRIEGGTISLDEQASEGQIRGAVVELASEHGYNIRPEDVQYSTEDGDYAVWAL